MKEKQITLPPSLVTIDLSSIAHNFRAVKERVGDQVKVLAVVKSDAYGHGLVPVAKRLSSGCGAPSVNAAHAFGVTFFHEGVILREAGITDPILILGDAREGEEDFFLKHHLTPAVSSMESLERLSLAAKKKNQRIKVHLKVDTGMSRLGMAPEEAVCVIKKISSSGEIEVEGLCTHLAFAFQSDPGKSRAQLKKFDDLVKALKKDGLAPPLIHACNSAGVFAHPEAHYNMVRTGIALYGSSPFDHPFPGLNLRPAMRWEARITHIRDLSPGASVSYGGHFIVKHESRVATLPVGYAHGLFRNLSGKIRVIVGGQMVPQVGTICMDFASVDVTNVKGCRVGDPAILLGSENGMELTAEEMAHHLGSIPYEIYCHVGRLAEKRYTG